MPHALLGCGFSDGTGRQGPLPTLSFYNPPSHLYHLSVPPYCPALVAAIVISHLDYRDWHLQFWFHPVATLPLTVFQMLLPLSVGPQIKTLQWFFTAWERKSKLHSPPGTCPLLSPYLWTLPDPIHPFQETFTQLSMLGQMLTLCPCWSLCLDYWYPTSFPQLHHRINSSSFSKYLDSLRTYFSERFLVKSSYYRLEGTFASPCNPG